MNYYPSADSSPLLAANTTDLVGTPPCSSSSTPRPSVHTPLTPVVDPSAEPGSWARSLPIMRKLVNSTKATDRTMSEKQQHKFATSDADSSPTRRTSDEKTPWYQTSQRWLL